MGAAAGVARLAPPSSHRPPPAGPGQSTERAYPRRNLLQCGPQSDQVQNAVLPHSGDTGIGEDNRKLALVLRIAVAGEKAAALEVLAPSDADLFPCRSLSARCRLGDCRNRSSVVGRSAAFREGRAGGASADVVRIDFGLARVALAAADYRRARHPCFYSLARCTCRGPCS